MNINDTENLPPVITADEVEKAMQAQADTAKAETTAPAETPAKPRRASKAGAHGKSSKKAAKVTKHQKATSDAPKAVKAKAAKPDADQYMAPYDNMKRWPVKTAGVAPTREHIITARALLSSPRSAGTKRELAIAAYLRDDALSWHTGAVANALMLVCGGTLNRLLNVVNADVCGSMGLAKLVAGKADGYKSYRLELNGKGKAKVARYMAANGLAVATGAVNVPEAHEVPAVTETIGEAATA